MDVIYKYPIEITVEQTINLPKGAQILTVQMQNDRPFIWALVDKDKPANMEHTIRIYGTGRPVSEGNKRYIGTFQQLDGRFIWHLFEDEDRTFV